MSLNKLGRYDIIRVLGKGAMGLVYEARDPNLDRRVAIKTIKVENLSEEAAAEYEARFRTEARSAARLQHPNIVSVYDSDRHGDIAYLVMEFIQGEDLKQHLDGGKRYSLSQSLGMVADLLAALDYAHRQNIVHRDVKPANLLIESNGRVKLTDFGVARIQDSGEATRTQGTMVGTLKYMSPEQVQGVPIDARADLFAVGVVLYQLLTGKRPFDGDTDFVIIQQIVGHTPAAPSTFSSALPAAIDAVVARALGKKREQRFATAQDFSDALKEAGGYALDPTIVLPPSQFGGQTSCESGATDRLSSSATDGGLKMTRELELVYWKDIKDSGDQEDLTGFLDKFPSGIYADLARRRLRKLGGTGLADGSGTESGATTPVASPHKTGDGARQHVQPSQLSQTTPSVADPLSISATLVPDAVSAAAPAGRRLKVPVLAGAGVAALLLVMLAFKSLSGPAAPTVSAQPGALATAPASAAAPAAGAAGAAGAAQTLPASTSAVAATAAPVARRAAFPVHEKTVGANPVPVRPGSEEGLAVASQGSVREMPASPVEVANPGQVCDNRVFLGFQSCMNEQCAKPTFSKHPVCVKRSNQEQLRRESQEQRN